MTNHRGFHLKGLYACLNLLQATATPLPAKPKVCFCGSKEPRPHSVDCAERLPELEDMSHSLPVLQSYWNMGWDLADMPPSLTPNAGIAFAMGRDCRMNRIEDNPILEVEPATLLPAHA
jgi:hypothetical protein